MEEKNTSLLTLFLLFSKLGLFTFGGGLVIIPLLRAEVVEKRGWISDDDIMDILTIAESTPGPISVNSATFIGYKVRGFWGAVISTLGLVLPSLIVITIISYIYHHIIKITLINYAFRGILAAVSLLVIGALFKFSKSLKFNVYNVIIVILVFALATFFEISAIYLIIGGAVIGFIYYGLIDKEKVRWFCGNYLLPSLK